MTSEQYKSYLGFPPREVAIPKNSSFNPLTPSITYPRAPTILFGLFVNDKVRSDGGSRMNRVG